VPLQGGNGIDTAVVYQCVAKAADAPLLDAPQGGLVSLSFPPHYNCIHEQQTNNKTQVLSRHGFRILCILSGCTKICAYVHRLSRFDHLYHLEYRHVGMPSALAV
jgi:hypothetical protein